MMLERCLYDLKVFLHRFGKDQSGNVIIYVTIFIFVFFGFVGLAIDFGRVYTTNSEAQSAADAAALAAASQLDGRSVSITRATNAAMTTPLVSNKQTYADGSVDDGTVVITGIRFLTGLPASDDDPITAGYETTDPLEARFAEVTTEALTHNNVFMVAIEGVDSTATLTATAVAGFNQVICNITPMMMCNPEEKDGNVGAAFDLDEYIGKQVLAKNHKGGGFWAPGNWGLLDSAAFPSGAKGVAQMLASATAPEACYDTDVDTETGAKISVNDAFNVRFDMYMGFFKNDQNNSTYRPAKNVTKGKTWTSKLNDDGTTDLCNDIVHEAPGTMGMPRDQDWSDDLAIYGTSTNPSRFGNGQWDCTTYWAANHPTAPPPGCGGPLTNTLTRFEVYEYEIANEIPNPVSGPTAEEGNPMCYTGATAPGTGPERRTMSVAVVNCVEQDVHGKSVGVATIGYIDVFITEPATEPSDSEGSDIFFEIVGAAGTGAAGGGLHDIVQLYR